MSYYSELQMIHHLLKRSKSHWSKLRSKAPRLLDESRNSSSSTRFLFLLSVATNEAICDCARSSIRVDSTSDSARSFSASNREASIALIISVSDSFILRSQSEKTRSPADSLANGVEPSVESQLSKSEFGGPLESSLSRLIASGGCAQDNIPASQEYFKRLRSLLAARFGIVGAVGSAIDGAFSLRSLFGLRQSIRKAIFQHSRTIRLPENVFGLLSKLTDARRSCIQEGNHCPSKEELARRVGITVNKLENLLMTTRLPLSMQQPVWSDQDTTFQEVTADTGIEIPDVSVAKQLMRQHVRNLLSVLSPKERRIIRLRYGIEGSKRNSQTEIGNMLELSNERVRQLEHRALCKLRQCLGKHGLSAYADLLL